MPPRFEVSAGVFLCPDCRRKGICGVRQNGRYSPCMASIEEKTCPCGEYIEPSSGGIEKETPRRHNGGVPPCFIVPIEEKICPCGEYIEPSGGGIEKGTPRRHNGGVPPCFIVPIEEKTCPCGEYIEPSGGGIEKGTPRRHNGGVPPPRRCRNKKIFVFPRGLFVESADRPDGQSVL